jgi:hypothetical protein
MDGPYADQLLDASDVCKNCFRTIRVERIDPTRNGFAGEYESSFERKKQTTSIEYIPFGYPTQSKTVFCNCGVSSAHHRIWEPDEISEPQLKKLIKNALRTLASKDVSLKRKETTAYILHWWREAGDVDKAFSRGLEMGIVATAASQTQSGQGTEDEING